ncbi:hypothetical protein PIB30_039089 [Stylosanthes scabra]|uniref:Uncharacterized protein n=1 Tax=Stylosanthes scabra TaxID=79078 RepID=A0ABU6YBK5_9FABA|nr:hypothetical protein [Stylosanthes scabra]
MVTVPNPTPTPRNPSPIASPISPSIPNQSTTKDPIPICNIEINLPLPQDQPTTSTSHINTHHMLTRSEIGTLHPRALQNITWAKTFEPNTNPRVRDQIRGLTLSTLLPTATTLVPIPNKQKVNTK